MIVFGYEREWAARVPGSDEVWRVILTTDEKDNVLIWRGCDRGVEQYTVNSTIVSDISWMITNCTELFKINELEDSVGMAYDIPCFSFIFSGNNINQVKYLSGYLFTYTGNGEWPNTDIVVNLTLKIQTILNKYGGVPLKILDWLKSAGNMKERDNRQDKNDGSSITISLKDAVLGLFNESSIRKLDIEIAERALKKRYGDSINVEPGSIKNVINSLVKDGTIKRLNSPDYYSLVENFSNKILHPSSLKDAVKLLFKTNPKKRFNKKTIRNTIKKKYNGSISTSSDYATVTLKSLVKDGFIRRIDNSDDYILNDVSSTVITDGVQINRPKKDEIDLFMESHIGKKIEFQYVSNYKNGDTRWRKGIVDSHNDLHFRTLKPDGGSQPYRKDKILGLREPVE